MCSYVSELHALTICMMSLLLAFLLNFIPASVTSVAGAGDLISDAVIREVSLASVAKEEKAVAPLAHPDGKVVVVIFGSVNCPVANSLVPEIRRIHSHTQAAGGAMYFVHPSKTVSIEKMRAHGKERKLKMPILYDPTHQLVGHLKATTTPEAFVLRREGENWTIVYRGLIDNLYADVGRRRRNASEFHVREAVTAAISKSPVKMKVRPAIGCLIEQGPAQ